MAVSERFFGRLINLTRVRIFSLDLHNDLTDGGFRLLASQILFTDSGHVFEGVFWSGNDLDVIHRMNVSGLKLRLLGHTQGPLQSDS